MTCLWKNIRYVSCWVLGDRVRAKSKSILAIQKIQSFEGVYKYTSIQVHFVVVMICTSQELDFYVAVLKAHTEADGDAILNDDPSLRAILHQ